MTGHWKVVLGVILIFLFGCISGWLSRSLLAYRQTAEFLQRGPEEAAMVLERRMTHNLDLDASQREQIHACFMENVNQRKQLQSQIQPQIQMLNRQTLRQITALLRPDQQERLRENLAQFRKRFGKGPFNPNAENQPSSSAPSSPAAPGNPGPDNPSAPSH
jgi:hypothetical protein